MQLLTLPERPARAPNSLVPRTIALHVYLCCIHIAITRSAETVVVITDEAHRGVPDERGPHPRCACDILDVDAATTDACLRKKVVSDILNNIVSIYDARYG